MAKPSVPNSRWICQPLNHNCTEAKAKVFQDTWCIPGAQLQQSTYATGFIERMATQRHTSAKEREEAQRA